MFVYIETKYLYVFIQFSVDRVGFPPSVAMSSKFPVMLVNVISVMLVKVVRRSFSAA